MPIIVILCLAVTSLLLLSLAWAFYQSPEKGYRATTHREEQLPQVMIDRYVAFAVIGLGLIFWGNTPMVAIFFLAGAIMGLGDMVIYARAGHSYSKHATAGGLSLVAMIITLVAS